MDAVRFEPRIRHWNPDKGSGLAVAGIPAVPHPAPIEPDGDGHSVLDRVWSYSDLEHRQ
jgi:hypothetical protein